MNVWRWTRWANGDRKWRRAAARKCLPSPRDWLHAVTEMSFRGRLTFHCLFIASFVFPKYADCLWGPSSLLPTHALRTLSPVMKLQRRETTIPLRLVPSLRKSGAIPPPTPLFHDVHTNCFIFCLLSFTATNCNL